MSEFAACLNEIREHHKRNIREGKRVKYTPSEKSSRFFVNDNKAANEADHPAIAEFKKQGVELGKGEADNNQTGITSETQTLQNAGATQKAQSNFKEQLERRREAAKEQAVKNVDKIYDTALEIGTQHPELQNQVLSVTDIISGLFNKLFGKVADFISGIVKAVVEWLKNAWESIKNTFSSIGSWISSWF
ncbi:MAG: hypothetical protein K2Q10_02465 [Rhodospirillales bacterium]|nr:hypothetical protein [Rhodospirillales bacterium]